LLTCCIFAMCQMLEERCPDDSNSAVTFLF